MVNKFSREYWTTHCGLDAYLYLLFQRRMLRLILAIGIISLIVSFPVNLFTQRNDDDWFE